MKAQAVAPGSVADGIAALNGLPVPDAEAALLRCCGSIRWARALTAMRPFSTREALSGMAVDVWRALTPRDWLQAFAAHPRIGAALPGTGNWSADEQAGAAGIGADLQVELAALNAEYEARFGHIFIVCASGLGHDEMFARIHDRIANAPEDELKVAAAEQERITQLRLDKLLTEGAH